MTPGFPRLREWLEDHLREVHVYPGIALLGWGAYEMVGWFYGSGAGLGAGLVALGGLLVCAGLFWVRGA